MRRAKFKKKEKTIPWARRFAFPIIPRTTYSAPSMPKCPVSWLLNLTCLICSSFTAGSICSLIGLIAFPNSSVARAVSCSSLLPHPITHIYNDASPDGHSGCGTVPGLSSQPMEKNDAGFAPPRLSKVDRKLIRSAFKLLFSGKFNVEGKASTTSSITGDVHSSCAIGGVREA